MNTSSKSARLRSSAVKSQIDENLKRVYEDALNEDVPDRFKLLLEQLKQAETNGSLPDGTAAQSASPAPQAAASTASSTASEIAE